MSGHHRSLLNPLAQWVRLIHLGPWPLRLVFACIFAGAGIYAAYHAVTVAYLYRRDGDRVQDHRMYNMTVLASYLAHRNPRLATILFIVADLWAVLFGLGVALVLATP